MKRAVVYVECCRDCPFSDNDSQNKPRKGGKTWCEQLDQEVGPDGIPPNCPLDDA